MSEQERLALKGLFHLYVQAISRVTHFEDLFSNYGFDYLHELESGERNYYEKGVVNELRLEIRSLHEKINRLSAQISPVKIPIYDEPSSRLAFIVVRDPEFPDDKTEQVFYAIKKLVTRDKECTQLQIINFISERVQHGQARIETDMRIALESLIESKRITVYERDDRMRYVIVPFNNPEPENIEQPEKSIKVRGKTDELPVVNIAEQYQVLLKQDFNPAWSWKKKVYWVMADIKNSSSAELSLYIRDKYPDEAAGYSGSALANLMGISLGTLFTEGVLSRENKGNNFYHYTFIEFKKEEKKHEYSTMQ